MKENNQRLLEFAIGYPPEGENARGVMILPNGILLEPGVKMQVDDNQSFSFKMRYCLNDGCYAFLNLNDKVLKMMKKGAEAKVSFLTIEGREVTIPMSLMGFTKAMRKIR